MSEFELIIRCSKDIRQITLDFGDSGVDVSAVLPHDSLAQTKPPKERTTDPLERYVSVPVAQTEKKSTQVEPMPSSLPVPDVENRAPLVDEGFNESL